MSGHTPQEATLHSASLKTEPEKTDGDAPRDAEEHLDYLDDLTALPKAGMLPVNVTQIVPVNGPSRTRFSPEHEKNLLDIQRFRNSLIVFISLFTSVLAFFLLLISVIEIETQPEKRLIQKIDDALYQELVHYRDQEAMGWLQIENTVGKGIKLSFSPQAFQDQQLFFSARARLNPYFLPYMQRLVALIKFADLPGFQQRYPFLVNRLLKPGQAFVFTIRVEGHTDDLPLAKTALYQSNLELSSFRAYAIMDFIRLYTHLPQDWFSIAGYGSFHPITQNPSDPLNRRVEIYLHPQILDGGERHASGT